MIAAPTFLLRNAAILDGSQPHLRPGCDVFVEGGQIREVSVRPITSSAATSIDLAGRTLMPGLIDCHVHTVASLVNLGANAALPNAIATLQAVPILEGMLRRGFTTVRDAGGADFALAQAVEMGLVRGPRLFVAGRALSQTGGHGDFRGRFDEREPCACSRRAGNLARVVDGIDAVRKAVREEIKAGAHQIKIMASGGIASPTDPIHFLGYSRDEIAAIADEAANADTYVMAHAYTAAAIERAVACGVRTIEHGNLVDDAAAAAMAAKGAYAVPTLVTYEALADEGAALGMPPESAAKIAAVREAGLGSLDIFRRNGVAMGFGSDLLGPMHRRQSEEFLLRGRVLPAHDVIKSATSTAAAILRMEGELGTVAEGAIADLIVVDGDPLHDLGALGGNGERIPLVMKAGTVVKNDLA
ncbi:MAG: amidohydrolase family protein [Rhodospirillaceae bacterium]|nr:amidohydrolase family protein [Rhodospirillaceae bacterium]